MPVVRRFRGSRLRPRHRRGSTFGMPKRVPRVPGARVVASRRSRLTCSMPARAGVSVRTFPTLSAAKKWREEAVVALRRGLIRAPTSTTFRGAAEALIAGMQAGSILDRSGKPYKPSSCRGYEQTLTWCALPHFGHMKLGQIERRDVQGFVEHPPRKVSRPQRSPTSSIRSG